MGWPPSLSELSFWANVGSIAGAVFTFGAFFYQLSLWKRYALLIRGPELIEELTEIGRHLNDYEELSSREQKTVLGGRVQFWQVQVHTCGGVNELYFGPPVCLSDGIGAAPRPRQLKITMPRCSGSAPISTFAFATGRSSNE